MAEAKWGTMTPIPYNEKDCGTLHIKANGTFDYTSTNNKVDENTIKANLIDKLQYCINEGKYETYKNIVSGNYTISHCVVDEVKIDGVTINKFTINSLVVASSDKEKYDKCISGEITTESNEQSSNQKSASKANESVIAEETKQNNDSFIGSNLFLIIGIIAIVGVVLFVVIKKKKATPQVENNTQQQVDSINTQVPTEPQVQPQQPSGLQNMYSQQQSQQDNNNINNNIM